MGVKVVIAETFQTATGGAEVVEVDGRTVLQSLKEVIQKYPGLEKIWFKDKDKLTNYIIIFINGENVHGDSLSQAVKDGDEIYPMLIIGGG